jgi:hypothetical protein
MVMVFSSQSWHPDHMEGGAGPGTPFQHALQRSGGGGGVWRVRAGCCAVICCRDGAGCSSCMVYTSCMQDGACCPAHAVTRLTLSWGEPCAGAALNLEQARPQPPPLLALIT